MHCNMGRVRSEQTDQAPIPSRIEHVDAARSQPGKATRSVSYTGSLKVPCSVCACRERRKESQRDRPLGEQSDGQRLLLLLVALSLEKLALLVLAHLLAALLDHAAHEIPFSFARFTQLGCAGQVGILSCHRKVKEAR
jgi:hypothetical protein